MKRYHVISLRRKKKWFALALAICAAASLTMFLLRPRASVPAPLPAEIRGIPIYEELLPEDTPGRPGQKRKIEWLVIHETANTAAGADAEAHSRFLQDSTYETALSWHYTVDDHQIYHHLPDDEVAYHASDQLQEGGGNVSGIGIELCVNSDGDFEQTLENAAALAAYLLDQYDLSLDQVKRHADFTDKVCPQTLIETGRWEEFLQMVEAQLEQLP